MQSTAYWLRMSDWRSDVCSSDLIGHRRAMAGVLAVENAQRVLLEPLLRIVAQFALHGAKMPDQRGAPGIAARRIAQRVEVQAHACNTQFFQQLVGHRQQFDIGLRFCRSEERRVGKGCVSTCSSWW